MNNNHISAAESRLWLAGRLDFAGQAMQRDRGGGTPDEDACADKAEPSGEGEEKQIKGGKQECASLKAGSY